MTLAAKLSMLTLALLFAACAPAPQVAQIPTLAILPSATPTATLIPTSTWTATATSAPTETATPDLRATEIAQLQLTNAAGEQTLAALQTLMAASPTFTPTPSLTITDTLTPTITHTPTPTDQPVEAMQPELLYVRAVANLRTCASRSCAQTGQAARGRHGSMATGRISGEAVRTRQYALVSRRSSRGAGLHLQRSGRRCAADAHPDADSAAAGRRPAAAERSRYSVH